MAFAEPSATLYADALTLTAPTVPVPKGNGTIDDSMPSKAPEIWRADVEATRRVLPPHKILSVSVVATPEPDWTSDDLAEDFARCAKWAVESGADCVEAKLRSPWPLRVVTSRPEPLRSDQPHLPPLAGSRRVRSTEGRCLPDRDSSGAA